MAVFSVAVSMAPVFRSTRPLVSTARAVRVQTTRVSANTSKIPHMPCITGSRTLELEWTITLEPRPASLENTPRFMPQVTASLTPLPTMPPPTAFMAKAPLKIEAKAGPILSAWANTTIKAPMT